MGLQSSRTEHAIQLDLQIYRFIRQIWSHLWSTWSDGDNGNTKQTLEDSFINNSINLGEEPMFANWWQVSPHARSARGSTSHYNFVRYVAPSNQSYIQQCAHSAGEDAAKVRLRSRRRGVVKAWTRRRCFVERKRHFAEETKVEVWRCSPQPRENIEYARWECSKWYEFKLCGCK